MDADTTHDEQTYADAVSTMEQNSQLPSSDDSQDQAHVEQRSKHTQPIIYEEEAVDYQNEFTTENSDNDVDVVNYDATYND